MTDIAELHAEALDATGRIVAGIPADRWLATTPCDGWDVRALVNHVVSGNMQSCQQVLKPQLELFRAAGAFAGPLPVPPGATGQTRFLAVLGRAG